MIKYLFFITFFITVSLSLKSETLEKLYLKSVKLYSDQQYEDCDNLLKDIVDKDIDDKYYPLILIQHAKNIKVLHGTYTEKYNKEIIFYVEKGINLLKKNREFIYKYGVIDSLFEILEGFSFNYYHYLYLRKRKKLQYILYSLIKSKKNYAKYYYFLGEIYYKDRFRYKGLKSRNKVDKAILYFKKVVEQYPEGEYYYRSLISLFDIFLEKKKYKKGIELIKNRVKNLKNSSTQYFDLINKLVKVIDPYLSLESVSHYLPGQKQKFIINWKNSEKLGFKLYKIKNVEKYFLNYKDKIFDIPEIVDKKDLKLLKKWEEIVFYKDIFKKYHKKVEFENLDSGVYCFEVTNFKNRVIKKIFKIGLTVTIIDRVKGGIGIFLVNSITGKPLKNGDIYLYGKNLKFHKKSDKKGGVFIGKKLLKDPFLNLSIFSNYFQDYSYFNLPERGKFLNQIDDITFHIFINSKNIYKDDPLYFKGFLVNKKTKKWIKNIEIELMKEDEIILKRDKIELNKDGDIYFKFFPEKGFKKGEYFIKLKFKIFNIDHNQVFKFNVIDKKNYKKLKKRGNLKDISVSKNVISMISEPITKKNSNKLKLETPKFINGDDKKVEIEFENIGGSLNGFIIIENGDSYNYKYLKIDKGISKFSLPIDKKLVGQNLKIKILWFKLFTTYYIIRDIFIKNVDQTDIDIKNLKFLNNKLIFDLFLLKGDKNVEGITDIVLNSDPYCNGRFKTVKLSYKNFIYNYNNRFENYLLYSMIGKNFIKTIFGKNRKISKDYIKKEIEKQVNLRKYFGVEVQSEGYKMVDNGNYKKTKELNFIKNREKLDIKLEKFFKTEVKIDKLGKNMEINIDRGCYQIYFIGRDQFGEIFEKLYGISF